ncbi:MAG: PEP-CTERM sorting domain-containing protein, partial [Terrimicrobiaceae bacterium]
HSPHQTGSHLPTDFLEEPDFQTTTTGGTAAAVNPGAPLTYAANFGAGTIFLDGTNGSSTWTSLATNPQVTAFTGTAVNTSGTSLSTTTTSPAALALANSSANGFNIVFTFSMAGKTDLTVSYATQKSGTGFNSNQWAYSTDGSSWTNFGSTIVPAASYAVVTLPTVTALDGDSSVFLRYTVSGASAAAGNNRLDNIQLNAVPEPSTWALIGLGSAFMMWNLRRKRRIEG